MRPEVAQPVLDRRAGQRDARAGLERLTARVCLAPGFLIAWASSRMTRCHGDLAQPGQAQQRAVAGDDEIDAGQALGGSALSSAAGIAEGWATSTFSSARSGRFRRPSWRAATPAPPGGWAVAARLALPALCALLLEHQQQRQHLDRLAQAHVVGQAGAEPEPRQQVAASRTPTAGRDAVCRASASPGSTRPGPPGWRRPRASRRATARPRSAPSRVGAVAGIVRRRRRPRAGAWPRRRSGPRRWRGARSPRIAPASARSRSRSTSTHWPRTSARPSVPGEEPRSRPP